jgi:hypothetical protein
MKTQILFMVFICCVIFQLEAHRFDELEDETTIVSIILFFNSF